jgi:hypothetical protein
MPLERPGVSSVGGGGRRIRPRESIRGGNHVTWRVQFPAESGSLLVDLPQVEGGVLLGGLQYVQLSVGECPFNVDWSLVELFDTGSDDGEFVQLLIGEGALFRAVSFSFDRAPVGIEPHRNLLRTERLLHDPPRDLVHDKMVRRDSTFDDRCPEAPVRVDGRLVVVVRHGIQREGDAGNVTLSSCCCTTTARRGDHVSKPHASL